MKNLKIPKKLYGRTAIIQVMPAWYVPTFGTVPAGAEYILNDALDTNLKNRILQAIKEGETFRVPNTPNIRKSVIGIRTQKETMEENPSLAFSTDTELEDDSRSASEPVEEVVIQPGFGTQVKDKPKKSERIKCLMCDANTHVIEKHLKKCKENKKAKLDLLGYTNKYPSSKILSAWAAARISGEE